MNTSTTASTLALCALLTITACTTASLTRSGADVDPVSLSSTFGNGPAGVGSDVLEQLVAVTAGEPVTVETPFTPPESDDNDGDAVKRLQAGQAEISVVRTDALEGAGAGSMAALTAPFAVTSDAQALKIASDPIAAKLLAGLDQIGLVGLRLVPGGLRHPVGYKTGLLGPADYKGQVINARPGPGVERIITALGGRIDHSVNAERSRRVTAGSLRGIEISFLQSGAADRPAAITSNVSLYTKFDVVVIRKRTFETLSAAQQKALETSVERAIGAALDQRPREEDAVLKWCRDTESSAIIASPDVVSQLKATLGPVTDGLRANPATAVALDRFAALHEGTTDATGATCEGPKSTATAEAPYRVTPHGDQTVLDGTWRTGAPKDELLAAGISNEKASANGGVWTVQITQGKGSWTQPFGEPCDGNFSFAGNKVTLDYQLGPDHACMGLSIGTFERKGDTVTFRWTEDLYEDVALDNLLYKTFVKVG